MSSPRGPPPSPDSCWLADSSEGRRTTIRATTAATTTTVTAASCSTFFNSLHQISPGRTGGRKKASRCSGAGSGGAINRLGPILSTVNEPLSAATSGWSTFLNLSRRRQQLASNSLGDDSNGSQHSIRGSTEREAGRTSCRQHHSRSGGEFRVARTGWCSNEPGATCSPGSAAQMSDIKESERIGLNFSRLGNLRATRQAGPSRPADEFILALQSIAPPDVTGGCGRQRYSLFVVGSAD